MNKKAIVGVALSCGIAGLMAAGVLLYKESNVETSPPPVENVESVSTDPEHARSQEEDDASAEIQETAEEEFEFGKNADIPPGISSEAMVIDFMHKMTHQKVVAQDKYGFIKMSPGNIWAIKESLVAFGDEFASKETLLSIINRWEAGDFSQVDQDHNLLWELGNGREDKIGRATGIATAEEEQAFMDHYFKERNIDDQTYTSIY